MADMTTKAIRIANKLWPDHGCNIRVRNQRRGYGHPESRLVTIPLWVMRSKKPGYVTYYIAHELAHVHSGSTNHDEPFYRSFIALCPKSYFRYEREYKPRAAKHKIAAIQATEERP